MKSSSDKSFFDFLGKVPPWAKLIAAFLVVAVVIISFSSEEKESEVLESDENKIAELCSMIEGVGECRAVVTYEEKKSYFSSEGERTVLAVAVICEGAEDVRVEAKIKKLISAMYGIGTNRIEVLCPKRT